MSIGLIVTFRGSNEPFLLSCQKLIRGTEAEKEDVTIMVMKMLQYIRNILQKQPRRSGVAGRMGD